MTTKAGHAADLSHPHHARADLGRRLAVASGVLVLLTGLAGPAVASTPPSPSESPSPTQPVAPSPSPSPSGNAPPEFLQCPGVLVQAGTPELIGFQVSDPDGDRVTLTAAGSSWGAETSITGHTLTYTAPPSFSGQDFIAVTADDGQGGTAVCDLSIRVEAQPDPTPTPTPAPTSPGPTTPPAPTPTDPPTPDPTTPAPSPTSTTPAPSQEPTSGPAPSAEPTPAPSSTAPPQTPPGGGSGGNGGDNGAGGAGGGDGDSNGANGHGGSESVPGTPGASASGSGGGPGSGPASPEGNAPSGTAPETSTTAQRLGDLPRETTVSCSLQAVEDARTLIQGISAGMASRPGGGSFPEGGAGEQDGTAPQDADGGSTPVAAPERATAVTGSSIWLFAGMGVLMLVLIGLAAAALPRAGRRH
ncbi:Ig-like domain-containing protein [Citricoccus sp. NPDC055426]|uniref:Ig-like domain-containing protein n=1 Tax=Citricoccus sp. NPDC055426 TaxID=3155536 RepID=UPI003434739E